MLIRLFAAVLAALMAWGCWQAVSTGAATLGWGPSAKLAERSTNPFCFWVFFVIKAGTAIMFAWLSINGAVAA